MRFKVALVEWRWKRGECKKKKESTGFNHQLHIKMKGKKESRVPLGFLVEGI